MEQHPNYFTFQSIPMEAACNPLLSPSDKIIFSSVFFLKKSSNEPCFASSEYLSEYNQISIGSVQRALKILEDLEYIKREIIKIKQKKFVPGAPKYKTQRKIHITTNPIWFQLRDLWNWAYPQKNEEARESWWDVLKGIQNLKKQFEDKNIDQNLCFMEELQYLIARLCGTYQKCYVPHTKNGTYHIPKISGILEKNIKKSINKEKYIKKEKPSGVILEKHFENIWNRYPRKTSKQVSKKAYDILCNGPIKNLPKLTVVLHSIKEQSKMPSWQNKVYIPHFSTWLNQRRWEDEVIMDSPKNNNNNNNKSKIHNGAPCEMDLSDIEIFQNQN